MGWVKRKADEHECPKPNLHLTWGVRAGDIWECDECHRQWEVCSGHQRDPGYYWTPLAQSVAWERPGG